MEARSQPDEWLERLAHECRRRPYRHVSEHFGFTAAGPFTRSTLLPLPYCGAAVDIGRDRVERLRAATGGPIGLEVLANTLAPVDAVDQERDPRVGGRAGRVARPIPRRGRAGGRDQGNAP